MPTTRQYTFDIDTKRYLNRVNTYRFISGLNPISNGDAVDIDNFIIGLKDLGLWHNATLWLMRSKHNAGIGSSLYATGGGPTYDITLINSPTWTSNGIFFNRTLDQYGRTGVVEVLNEFGAFVVVDYDRNNNAAFINQDRWSGSLGDNGSYWVLQRATSTQVQFFLSSNAAGSGGNNLTAPTSGFIFHSAIKSFRGNVHSVNGGTTSNPGINGIFLGTRRSVIALGRQGFGSSSAMTGTMAVACHFNTAMIPTQSIFQSFNSLLRQTIVKDILTT